MARKKTALEKLSLNELSLVDKGANQHAAVTIFKSAQDESLEAIIKYYDSVNGKAVDFNSILDENKKWKALCEAREEFYPLFNALQSSVTSNFSDTSLSAEARQANIERDVAEFLAAVREIVPELEDELMKMFANAGSSGDINPDGEKIVSEDLTKKLAEVEKALAEKTAELEKANMSLAEMKAAEEKKKKMDEMKKNDETVSVAGTVVSKSAVGEEQFAVFKAMAAENEKLAADIAKARDEAEMAQLEKRAAAEFAHLPGTVAEHAAILKAVKAMPEAVAKSFEAIMKSADEAAAKSFQTIGKNFAPAAGSAEERLEKAAEDIRKASPLLTKEQAIVKAYELNPELVKELV